MKTAARELEFDFKRCSLCGLFNATTATRCVCGFIFVEAANRRFNVPGLRDCASWLARHVLGREPVTAPDIGSETEGDFYSDTEQCDAGRVNAAVQAIVEGRLGFAERELLAVVANAPLQYKYAQEIHNESPILSRAAGRYDCTQPSDTRLCIKAWTPTEFQHYAEWHETHGTLRPLAWLPAAYPKAYFYLGVIHFEQGNLPGAIDQLRRGLELEANPRFAIKWAAAYNAMGRPNDALRLLCEYTCPSERNTLEIFALASRGIAAILLESGLLDAAEDILKGHLELLPDDEAASTELDYIGRLRRGEAPGRLRTYLGAPDGRWVEQPLTKH